MTTEHPTARSDAARRGDGVGIGGILIGLGLVALLAVIAFVVMSANRNQALRTDAVTSAASSLAASNPPPR